MVVKRCINTIFIPILFFLFLTAGVLTADTRFAGDTAVQSATVTEGSQEQTGKKGVLDVEARTQLAVSNPSYPVTPGDVYSLQYTHSLEPQEMRLVVESDYTVNLSVFGKINVRGMTFLEFRSKVDSLVKRAYPESFHQLLLLSVGVFTVHIQGEVDMAQEVTAWGMTRLGELLADHLTEYSSRRNITVVDYQGCAHEYDLFSAKRYGEIKENPYVRPGDTIIVETVKRKVTIEGEVKRPGEYELLPGETLGDLVQQYANGFTETADPEHIEITRHGKENGDIGTTDYADYFCENPGTEVPVGHYDVVSVPSKRKYLPVVFFEGAIGDMESGKQLEASNRFPYRFEPGEKLSTAVLSFEERFCAVSDLENAFIRRAGRDTIIPIDLQALLYENGTAEDIELKHLDSIIIPFRQFFVTVSGAVHEPGRYPYAPNKRWSYYVGLAGGIDTSRNADGSRRITDIHGNPISPDAPITPEATVYVEENSFLYHFGRIAPVVTTTLSAASLIITILNAVLDLEIQQP